MIKVERGCRSSTHYLDCWQWTPMATAGTETIELSAAAGTSHGKWLLACGSEHGFTLEFTFSRRHLMKNTERCLVRGCLHRRLQSASSWDALSIPLGARQASQGVGSTNMNFACSQLHAGIYTDYSCPGGPAWRYHVGLLCERLYQQVGASTSLRLPYCFTS